MEEIVAEERLSSVLKPHLDPGESLTWVGRPSPKRFRVGIAAEVASGLIVCVAASAVFAAFSFAGLRDRTATTWRVGSVLFGAVGIQRLSAPIRYRRALAKPVYAVTTERAVMLNGFGVQRGIYLRKLQDVDRSFEHAATQGREVKCQRRDGSGDIVFDQDPANWDRMGPMEIGFFGVTDVDQVVDLSSVRSPQIV